MCCSVVPLRGGCWSGRGSALFFCAEFIGRLDFTLVCSGSVKAMVAFSCFEQLGCSGSSDLEDTTMTNGGGAPHDDKKKKDQKGQSSDAKASSKEAKSRSLSGVKFERTLGRRAYGRVCRPFFLECHGLTLWIGREGERDGDQIRALIRFRSDSNLYRNVRCRSDWSKLLRTDIRLQ